MENCMHVIGHNNPKVYRYGFTDDPCPLQFISNNAPHRIQSNNTILHIAKPCTSIFGANGNEERTLAIIPAATTQ
jgi:hypothetical protein